MVIKLKVRNTWDLTEVLEVTGRLRSCPSFITPWCPLFIHSHRYPIGIDLLQTHTLLMLSLGYPNTMFPHLM